MSLTAVSRFLFPPVKLFGAAALSALLASALLPAGVCAQGLDLEAATEKVLEAYDAPNPHFELDCTDCHDPEPDFDKDTWATVKFVNGDAGIVDLCYQCHDASDNVHPVHVDPTTAKPPIKVPEDFPLERYGEKKGTVVCITCHYIHTKTAGMKLLRGFPVSADPADMAQAKFTDRRQLCEACHRDKLAEKSPHKGKEAAKKNCSFCHSAEPKEGEPVEFVKNPVELCDFCHAASKNAHFLLVNPFADPNLTEEIPKANLPMFEGQYTCVSCHNPHGGTGLGKFMRQEFVDLALKSGRIRPHFLGAFCEACHTVKPTTAKGEPGAQPLSEIPLRSDDPNELCNRCHESGLSKANAHPIKEVPEAFKARIPEGWPLYNGGLTCLTCHTGGDSPVFDPENPSFLRGAPYETRNAICWNCHTREEFAELNPHERIQDLEGCEFCHQTKPDLDKLMAGEAQEVKFKGDIVILCIRCHDDNPHPAGSDHTGLPDKASMDEKGIIIPEEFPLDANGKVTCSTCHNPHAEGALRGDFVGMMVCMQCHTRL
jgi:hypothetical protein